MADVFTRAKRSEIMSKIRSRDTAPELATRKTLRKLGLRFGVCRREIPGFPDIVLRKIKTTVFVHGCFWHQHSGCARCSMPSSNRQYWRRKLARNVERFGQVKKVLLREGWRVMIVWECQTKNEAKLQRLLGRKLGINLNLLRGGMN